MTHGRLLIALALSFVACRDATGDDKPAPAPRSKPNDTVTVQPTKETPVDDKVDLKKGDQQDKSWVPAEFKSGASRWKDTGVYLDGKPIAFMTFGELPIGLKPTWVRDKVSANKRPHSNDPGFRWSQQRFYKFTDYLTALGVDPKKIKELHVYGPKFTQSIIVTRADLQTPLADKFMFRFGTGTSGKAIPQLPAGFANGKTPDKIASLMIYIDKTPPQLDVEQDGFVLDGHLVKGVPYYGEPLRGGVRVYLDNRLAAIIKRQELDPKAATKASDGELEWGLAGFLKSKGIETKKVVEGWVIRDDRRAEKLAASELVDIKFEASSQAKGGVTLGDKKLRANAIALHTHPVLAADLPVVTPDER